MKGRRVLITGGSGFIGSHLVFRLLDLGATVAVSARYGNVVKNERLRACWDRITVIEADHRNRGALEACRDWGPEFVFHLAAYNHVGESFRQVEECFDVNAKGTANTLDVCPGSEAFVYMCTSEVYGHQESVPFVESMCPQPMSPYAITKYAGELYCRMKQRIGSGPRVVIVRAFNTFGPYQSSKAVIPELVLKCLRGEPVSTTQGEQTREFNYVSNIVDGLLAAALHPARVDGPVNLASGEEVRIRDLVTRIHALAGSRSELRIGALEYRPNEIWRMRADATRARATYGWTPAVSLEEGLRRTVEWFRTHGDRDWGE